MTTSNSQIAHQKGQSLAEKNVSVANIPASSTAAPLAPAGPVLEPPRNGTDSQATLTTNVGNGTHNLGNTTEKNNVEWIKSAQGQDYDEAYNEKAATELNRSSTSVSSSSSSTLTQPQVPADLENSISRVSTDPLGNTYPEGGRQAYLVVFGSFCGCVISLGLMNTLSTYSAYLTTHQLAGQSESTIGWIFGIYAFLSFFLGLQIGPFFDSYGPRLLVAIGSTLIILTYIILSWCTRYWHFIVVFSILGGTGTSMVFTPSIAAVGHWFYLRRGTFTGIACVGGSLGGVIFPLVLQRLFGTSGIGWPWSQRILALINLPLAICANVFIRSRLPPRQPITKENILPDPRIFKDPTFALVTAAVFSLEWGLFVPISYFTSFALSIGVDQKLSYQLIAVFNAGSCFGRWLPGLIADRIGRFNAMALTTVICWIGAFAFWLPSEQLVSSSESARLALLIVFAIVFGFGSGAGISLVPVCVGQLCRTEQYGRYYATCYTIVSFATLTGIPIAGSLITAAGGRYWGLIVFTGLGYAVATVIFVFAKGTKTGFGRQLWTEKF
ncbi:hypothetical protein H2198_008481 [Neophaeococcomyces mojaviensis]|uniref:Uncharacterized protein n=1 Tax=Neophaeococcomyces mojaviensis TaxID=3383035 RepID=A0ACC2ZX99_9EURO|nr:hypothetical protein H2198_008481 [Knufia sp. JES_112]